MKRSRSRRLAAAFQALASEFGRQWQTLRTRGGRRRRPAGPRQVTTAAAHRALHAKIMEVVRREARREARAH